MALLSCAKCGNSFKRHRKVDGKWRNLGNRVNCLECVPYGSIRNIIRVSIDGQTWRCARCEAWFPISEKIVYNSNRKSESFCRDCKREYDREYYKENFSINSKKKNAFAAERRRITKSKIDAYKDRPCLDCGIRYPAWAMEFDHRDPSTKLFDISSSFRYVGKDLMAEIQKCDLVCTLCHRFRTNGFRRSKDGSATRMSLAELKIRKITLGL